MGRGGDRVIARFCYEPLTEVNLVWLNTKETILILGHRAKLLLGERVFLQ